VGITVSTHLREKPPRGDRTGPLSETCLDTLSASTTLRPRRPVQIDQAGPTDRTSRRTNGSNVPKLVGITVSTHLREKPPRGDRTGPLSETCLDTLSAPVFGIMIDESTTVSSEGKLIIYLRFLRHGRVLAESSQKFGSYSISIRQMLTR
jgi:hypothetical protein